MSLFDHVKARKSGHDLTSSESEVRERFLKNFEDPYFAPFRHQLEALAEIAVKAHKEGRKAPLTEKAGARYQDPSYELSVDWIKARDAIEEAQRLNETSSSSRILLINGSDRNENTCPGEMSKSARLIEAAKNAIARESKSGSAFEIETLDLSRVTSEYGRTIHPCKGCVSTSMALCHWPCSCYPNHSLGQVHDWMNEIYPMWVRAHGIFIVTPVYWYQSTSVFKLMMDRMVCADGGNADPTSTHGKKVEEAKKLELKGWPFPKHLEGRVYSVVVHGDAAGADTVESALTNWLQDMKLVPAGQSSSLARYIGYMGKYAESHEALDRDEAMITEVENRARGLAMAVTAARAGKLRAMLADAGPEPRLK